MAKQKKKTRLDVLKKRLKSIKAKDIMSRKVITISEDKTLSEVAKLMIKKRISGLPVLGKNKKMTGIIVDHDLFLVMDMIESGNIIEENDNTLSDPKVNYAMSKEVITVKKTTNLDKIISTMKYRNVHTLPVMQGKKIAGIIGRRDVYQVFYNTVKDLKV